MGGMPYRGSAGAPTGRRSVERGEWAGFAGAAAVALIHALDLCTETVPFTPPAEAGGSAHEGGRQNVWCQSLDLGAPP